MSAFAFLGLGLFLNMWVGLFNAQMKLRWFQSPGLIQKIHTNTMESVSLLREDEI